MFYEKNEAAARQARQRLWIGGVAFVIGALAMLLIVLGH